MQKLSQESIARLIAGTRRSIKQYAWEKLRPWRVTPQQCNVLLVLHNEGGMSLGEVAGRIWCDNPTACRIVNKLVERGFVRSDSDSQDRRRFRLFLTEEGETLSAELARCADAIAVTLEEGLAPDDLSTLRRILGHVMGNAVKATQRPDKTSAAAIASHTEAAAGADKPARAARQPATAPKGSPSRGPVASGGSGIVAGTGVGATGVSPATPAATPIGDPQFAGIEASAAAPSNAVPPTKV